MSPRAHVMAGGLLAAGFIALYTVVGNEVNLILAVIMAAVGFNIGAREADQRDAEALAAWQAEERAANIAWWRGALNSAHPAEAILAPAMLAFLGAPLPAVPAAMERVPVRYGQRGAEEWVDLRTPDGVVRYHLTD